jgi:hypothetical protein
MKLNFPLSLPASRFAAAAGDESAPPPGLVFIPGGTFAMGSALPGSRRDGGRWFRVWRCGLHRARISRMAVAVCDEEIRQPRLRELEFLKPMNPQPN